MTARATAVMEAGLYRGGAERRNGGRAAVHSGTVSDATATGAAPAPDAGAGQGARTYRAGSGVRALAWVAAAASGAAGVWAAATIREGAAERIAAGAAFALFAALAVLAAEQARRLRVTIDDAGIEYVEWSRPRRMRVDEMRGRRFGARKGGGHLVFEPRRPGAKALRVPALPSMDAGFHAWLARIPDLDAADLARWEAEALAALGATPREREARLAPARWLSWPINLLGFLGGTWAMFFPRPYAWAVGLALAMPLVALAATVLGRGGFQLLGATGDPRRTVGFAIVWPTFACAMRATDFDLVSLGPVLLPAALGGVVLTGVAMAGDRAFRRTPKLLPFAALWFAFQAGAMLSLVNCAFDRSCPAEHAPVVLDKWTQVSKSRSWWVRVEAWGPFASPQSVQVPPFVYEEVTVGKPARIRLREGRLGFPWFRVIGG